MKRHCGKGECGLFEMIKKGKICQKKEREKEKGKSV